MGKEVDLLVNYPKSKRNIMMRNEAKSDEHRKIARTFGKQYFDGDRSFGYGGYRYNPRFWEPVIPTFADHYLLNNGQNILDVGCGKGFMLYDMSRLVPGIKVRGLDISQYAFDNSLEDIKPFIDVGNATDLPYSNNSFDLVISINTIHNLEQDDCIIALKEIERVSKGNSFVVVDAFRNDEERKRIDEWNITALTYLHVNEWADLFNEAGYSGDYYWFIP
jgi:SAM-dependent methyltransferase